MSTVFISLLSLPSWSLLHGASLKYDTDITRLLLAHGATVDIVDKHGSTPLSYAASFGAVECCELLVEAGTHPHVLFLTLTRSLPGFPKH